MEEASDHMRVAEAATGEKFSSASVAGPILTVADSKCAPLSRGAVEGPLFDPEISANLAKLFGAAA